MTTHATLWNIFLALIPVVMAALLGIGASPTKTESADDPGTGTRWPWYVWFPIGLVWLAFLPNACYLVTEWRHLLFDDLPYLQDTIAPGRDLLISVGKDSFFYLIYSGVGSFCFMLSVRPIERLLRRHGVSTWYLAPPFFFAISLAVYLGLIVRLNSWDLVVHPHRVIRIAVQAVLDPTLCKAIVVLGFMLFLLYEILDIFLDGLILRRRRWRNNDRRQQPEAVPFTEPSH